MKLFSVVIPAFNAVNYIEETIDSVLNQEFKNYEIIIVDDGSTDDTYELLQKYKSKIKIIRQSNQGSTAARNRGINIAKGTYIVALDHDDILLPKALNIYKRTIEHYNNPPIIVGKLKWFNNLTDLQPLNQRYTDIATTKFSCFYKKSGPFFYSNSSLIIKKNILKKIGCYPSESFAYDDNRLLFRLGNIGPLIKIYSPTSVGYRWHKTNWSSNKEYMAKGLLALIEDEWAGRLPGGKKYSFDRKGLISTNALSVIRRDLGFKNIFLSVKVGYACRYIILYGPIRIWKARFYKSNHVIIDV